MGIEGMRLELELANLLHVFLASHRCLRCLNSSPMHLGSKRRCNGDETVYEIGFRSEFSKVYADSGESLGGQHSTRPSEPKYS